MKIMFGIIAVMLCCTTVHAYTIVDSKTTISDGYEGSVVEHIESSDFNDKNFSDDLNLWDGEEE